MKFNRLGAFTLGVIITAVSVGAVSFVNAAGNGTLKACANKTTGVMRYISKGSCKKTETTLSWNRMGSQGLPGASGTNGTAGAKGDTGTTGAKGDTGAAGSSFTARSVCGIGGTTLCAVGEQGPGGGTVFYVDTEGRYSDFDYLEVAPADASTGVAWSTTTLSCGLSANTSCWESFLTTSGEALNFLAIGTGRAATAAIVARHDAGGVAKNLYAAGVADAYTTATASDWFLPSRDELNEVCKYARNTSQAVGAASICSGGTLRTGFASGYYWSSSESDANRAWVQAYNGGGQYDYNKTNTFYVRPVRAF